MGLWDKFWKWHNEAWNDPTPIVGFQCLNDGQGNKVTRAFIGNSKFETIEQVHFDEGFEDFNNNEIEFEEGRKIENGRRIQKKIN